MTRSTHLMMDDLLSFDFLTYHTSSFIPRNISVLFEICTSLLMCMIIPIYEIHV